MGPNLRRHLQAKWPSCVDLDKLRTHHTTPHSANQFWTGPELLLNPASVPVTVTVHGQSKTLVSYFRFYVNLTFGQVRLWAELLLFRVCLLGWLPLKCN